MSLHPQPIDPVPPETARVAHAAFPKGNPYMLMRDELGTIYEDAQFTALFPTRGQPAEAPWRLALILVFQFVEALSDRQAADAVRSRIDWKYALGLELTDPGFDASVLSEFRARLIHGGAEQQLLDVMLTRFRAAGLLRARGQARTDSTHILAAVRALNRLQTVGEAMRYALNTLAVVAPTWVQPQIAAAWLDRYGPRFDDYRLPKAATERDALAVTIGRDGVGLLTALYAGDTPLWLRQMPAVAALRAIWVQQYVVRDGVLQWRAAADLPPAGQMINSPYDIEARYSYKRNISWVGYKIHLTETCDEELPHLITHVATTVATTSDFDLPPQIHADLATKDLLPAVHLFDSGYVESSTLVHSEQQHGIRVVGPVRKGWSWQTQAADRFGVTAFTIDWEAQQVRCPAGKVSSTWSPTHDPKGEPIINIAFRRADCAGCELRRQCTQRVTAPRTLGLRPQAQHVALQAARERQGTAAFKAEYARRAGIEGTIEQGLAVCEMRRSRYVGLAKTELQHVLTGAALNVRRVGAWLSGEPRAHTRTAAFVALVRHAA